MSDQPGTPGGQVSGGVRLYATKDGGTTWIPRFASPLLAQASLDFITPAAGFAAVTGPHRSYLLRTSDAGATWTGVTRPARRARMTSPICRTASSAPLPARRSHRAGLMSLAIPPHQPCTNHAQ